MVKYVKVEAESIARDAGGSFNESLIDIAFRGPPYKVPDFTQGHGFDCHIK